MKKLLQTLMLFITVHIATAQTGTVGIGTNTPNFPLTVISQNNKGIVQKNADVEVGFYTSCVSKNLIKTDLAVFLWQLFQDRFITNCKIQFMNKISNLLIGKHLFITLKGAFGNSTNPINFCHASEPLKKHAVSHTQ